MSKRPQTEAALTTSMKVTNDTFFRVDGEGRVEFYCAVFANVDKVGDRIVKGAFTRTLKEWRASGDPIPVVFSHTWDSPLSILGEADPRECEEDDIGLLIRAKLYVTENPVAAYVWKLMTRRVLRESSFSFDVAKGGERRARDGANELTDLTLIEVGPCLKGANPLTDVLDTKAWSNSMATPKQKALALVRFLEGMQRAYGVKMYANDDYADEIEQLEETIRRKHDITIGSRKTSESDAGALTRAGEDDVSPIVAPDFGGRCANCGKFRNEPQKGTWTSDTTGHAYSVTFTRCPQCSEIEMDGAPNQKTAEAIARAIWDSVRMKNRGQEKPAPRPRPQSRPQPRPYVYTAKDAEAKALRELKEERDREFMRDAWQAHIEQGRVITATDIGKKYTLERTIDKYVKQIDAERRARIKRELRELERFAENI